ncbi:MAG: M16 family metallopeptidase [Longimicrobiales bacterium]
MTRVPAVGELRPFAPPGIQRARLGNGLEVIIAEKRGLPVVDVQLIVRAGAVGDATTQAGRASLTAELMDEGTRQHSAIEISDLVELLGADLELHAGWDAIFLALHGLRPRLGPMLDLLTEVALQPTFPADEFKRKQEERVHGLLQERSEPRAVAVKALARAVFGAAHIYGWPLSGTVDSLGRMDRAALLEHYGNFAPGRAHVVVAGHVDADQIVRELDHRLGDWSGTPLAESLVPPAPESARRILLIDRPGAAQSEVRIGHVGLSRDTPDYFAVLVLNTVLGGSFKSRLNMILREEKGFTYGASSSFAFRRAGGLFSAGAAVFTDATAETVSIVVREIERMAQFGATAEELERARRYLSLGFVRTFETTSDVAGHLADLVLFDLGDDYLQTYAERVAAVSAADVAGAASRYLHTHELAIVIVGDRARVLEPLQRLELAPVIEVEAE